jgi:2-keto-4-pentenoate hydratase
VAKNLTEIADRLIAAQDKVATLPPITSRVPDFSVADGYAVLADIEAKRRAQGWRAIGRKIGFTNRTIWPRYGVFQPMWAHVWTRTVQFAETGNATLDVRPFVQPRIEPEVVFKLKAPVPVTDDPIEVLTCTEWLAPGFEIVQSHFPDWKFTAPDCTAACGLQTLPQFPPLAAGEIVTTGTITDAWPVAAGETWSSDYGALPIEGLTLRFT